MGAHHEADLARAVAAAALQDLAAGLGLSPSRLVAVNGLAAACRFAVSAAPSGIAVSAAARQGLKVAVGAGPVVPVDSAGQTQSADAPGHDYSALAFSAANHETGLIDQATGFTGFRVVDATEWAGRVVELPAADVLILRASSWGGPASACFVVLPQAPNLSDKERLMLSPEVSVVAAAAAAWSDLGGGEGINARGELHRQWLDDFAAQVAALPGVQPIVGSEQLPHLLALQLETRSSEELARLLDARGIAVGSGSACDPTGGEPSAVLRAMGYAKADALRVSLPLTAKESDLEHLLEALTLLLKS